MPKNEMRHASWQELLGPPSPASHIVQIYDSDDFLVAAVGHFVVEGLRRGEAVLLTGTETHLRRLRQHLHSQGLNADAAMRAGQLLLSDADAGVRAILDGQGIDAARYEALTGEALSHMRADERFSGLRWWGEMTNILHRQGRDKAALAAEAQADAIAKRHGVTLLCSFHCDRFDPRSYDGMMREVCCRHTHVIPAQDYVRHRLAVNHAIEEVVGEIRGPLLQSLMSWKGLPCELPSSQALLFWVRDCIPERFAEVLERARAYPHPGSSMEAA